MNFKLGLQDPEQDLTEKPELDIVMYMKTQAAAGVLEHTLNNIYDGLKDNGISYPKSRVSNALALLSDSKRGVLSSRTRGNAVFYCLQTIVDLCHGVWGA